MIDLTIINNDLYWFFNSEHWMYELLGSKKWFCYNKFPIMKVFRLDSEFWHADCFFGVSQGGFL